MTYEYWVINQTDWAEVGTKKETLSRYLNCYGALGWRAVIYDRPASLLVFEREIAINENLRKAQLEGDSLWKNEKLESSG